MALTEFDILRTPFLRGLTDASAPALSPADLGKLLRGVGESAITRTGLQTLDVTATFPFVVHSAGARSSIGAIDTPLNITFTQCPDGGVTPTTCDKGLAVGSFGEFAGEWGEDWIELDCIVAYLPPGYVSLVSSVCVVDNGRSSYWGIAAREGDNYRMVYSEAAVTPGAWSASPAVFLPNGGAVVCEIFRGFMQGHNYAVCPNPGQVGSYSTLLPNIAHNADNFTLDALLPVDSFSRQGIAVTPYLVVTMYPTNPASAQNVADLDWARFVAAPNDTQDFAGLEIMVPVNQAGGTNFLVDGAPAEAITLPADVVGGGPGAWTRVDYHNDGGAAPESGYALLGPHARRVQVATNADPDPEDIYCHCINWDFLNQRCLLSSPDGGTPFCGAGCRSAVEGEASPYSGSVIDLGVQDPDAAVPVYVRTITPVGTPLVAVEAYLVARTANQSTGG